MIPGRYDITIYRGGTYHTRITARDSSGMTVDFTQYTALRMQIRPPWTFADGEVPPPPWLELTSENGGLAKVNLGLGLELTIDADVTAALPWTDGRYDLELVILEEGVPDVVDKLLYGKVHVMEEVTV